MRQTLDQAFELALHSAIADLIGPGVFTPRIRRNEAYGDIEIIGRYASVYVVTGGIAEQMFDPPPNNITLAITLIACRLGRVKPPPELGGWKLRPRYRPLMGQIATRVAINSGYLGAPWPENPMRSRP